MSGLGRGDPANGVGEIQIGAEERKCSPNATTRIRGGEEGKPVPREPGGDSVASSKPMFSITNGKVVQEEQPQRRGLEKEGGREKHMIVLSGAWGNGITIEESQQRL